MTGALQRNPRILACVLLGAVAIGGLAWYAAIPDAPSLSQSASPPGSAPPLAQSTLTPPGSRELDDATAVRLFEVVESAGIKVAFEQLETEYATGNIGRARVWFALKCLSRDPKQLSAVVAQLKSPNERGEVLFAGAARLVSRNLAKPEAFDQLSLSKSEQRGVHYSIVTALAEDRRFSEALSVLNRMEKSDQRKGALMNLVESYARADAANAVSELKQLEGDDRREARSILHSVLREKGNADGLRSMLLDSQDDAEKQRLVSSIVKAYGTYRDNVSASQFVDSLDGSLQEAGQKALAETFH